MQKEKIILPRATLDIFKYEEDSIVYYEFDATHCQPPEPMVNAMACLSVLKSKDERLVGYFFHEPSLLYDKISKYFTYEATELENGDFKIVFQLI
jgi:hypothetical protein